LTSHSLLTSFKNGRTKKPKPFQIAVSDELLSFINQRVSTARIPPGLDLPEQDVWSFGIPSALISELRDYWEKKYD
jgi:hypothetical protein